MQSSIKRPLRVLQFICSSGFYGAEMWILALAKNLDNKKADCQFVMTRESNSQNFEIYHRFRKLGLKAHRLDMKGRFDPRVVFKLVKLIRNEKIDIIHTHGYKSDIIGLAAARIAGIKALSTPHGFENAKDIKLQTFIRIGCLALRFFDRVSPLSKDLENDLKLLGIRSNKISLIINGVDLTEIEQVQSVTNQATDITEKTIGFIGQMAHRKNVGDLIRTFDLLYREYPNIRMILVGDGPKRQELEAFAHTLPSSHKIFFLGYRNDRLEILKKMDIFSMTSSLEGIPRCLMESMAMGIPVAAYNIPGVDDLIYHGKTGLMAEFGNIKELKKCWEKLLFDSEYSQKLSKNAHQLIFENYSAMRMANEYLILYNNMYHN